MLKNARDFSSERKEAGFKFLLMDSNASDPEWELRNPSEAFFAAGSSRWLNEEVRAPLARPTPAGASWASAPEPSW